MLLSRACRSAARAAPSGVVAAGGGKRTAPLVSVRHADLVAGKDLSGEILRAYGPDGLGALSISGIPGYAAARNRLVPLSWRVANLPDRVKARLEHEPSMWNVGWSHGKEKLGDTPDFAKGSYYGNPLHDAAGNDDLRAKYPFFYPKNIWPGADLPELEPAFKELGTIMHRAVVLLTKQIDALAAARVPNYKPRTLFDALSNTQKVKGRVLYYYPPPAASAASASEDGWIGWHNDSGFLTALTRDMYFDHATGRRIDNPDPAGGLWIMQRGAAGSAHVTIPEDELAVQCGEVLQVITGGLLVATPHCVRASKSPSGMAVSRGTFPVFIDSAVDFPMSAPAGVPREQVLAAMTSRVPPLGERWLRDGVPFVEFLGDTFKMYYNWAKRGAKQ